LLLNPFYAGLIRWNGIEAQGAHEPLVDLQTRQTCLSILREHDQDRERRSRHNYVLNRLLYWAELGCRSHAEHQAHAGASYYRSIKPGPDGSRICIRCEVVDDQVGRILEELEIPPSLHPALRRAYRREISEIAAPYRSRAAELRRRLVELEEESRGYVRLAAQGRITEEEFDAERRRVQGAIAAVREELTAVETGGQSQLSDLDLALAFSARLGRLWERADAVHRRAIAHLVFKRVSIDNSGTVVDYQLAPPFGYLAALKGACRPVQGGPSRSKHVASGLPAQQPQDGSVRSRPAAVPDESTALPHGLHLWALCLLPRNHKEVWATSPVCLPSSPLPLPQGNWTSNSLICGTEAARTARIRMA
jgi:hypothetical protein